VEAPARGARVSRISIAPVKGLALQQVATADVGLNGVAENRRLHLVDAAGRLVNGKTSMRLSLVASRLDLEARTLGLEFPEGDVVAGAHRDDLLRPARDGAPRRRPLERSALGVVRSRSAARHI